MNRGTNPNFCINLHVIPRCVSCQYRNADESARFEAFLLTRYGLFRVVFPLPFPPALTSPALHQPWEALGGREGLSGDLLGRARAMVYAPKYVKVPIHRHVCMYARLLRVHLSAVLSFVSVDFRPITMLL